MKEKVLALRNHPRLRQLADVRNIGLYVFALIVLSVSWSGVKVIQSNYALQRQIATLEQEVQIADLENGNMQLRNQYYQTDQFLELAARRQFGMAAPGEQMIVVPRSVALAHAVDVPKPVIAEAEKPKVETDKPVYQQNLEAWLDFFLHLQNES
jgi:cell division protein FtsB